MSEQEEKVEPTTAMEDGENKPSQGELEDNKDKKKSNIDLALVDLFTKSGLQLEMVESPAIKILLQPLCDAMEMSLSRDNVIQRITNFSAKLKTEIYATLQNKPISLKIDIVTKEDLSLLAIHVQYVEGESLKMKILALKEYEASSSEYLKSVILDALREESIDINQILTITTDNDHIFDAVNGLKKDFEEPDPMETEMLVCDLTKEGFGKVETNFTPEIITNLRSSSNILQHCVRDIFKAAKVHKILERCRKIFMHLRTASHPNIIKEGSHKLVNIDCETNWMSTYSMMQTLLEIKDLIDVLRAEDSFPSCNEIWSYLNSLLKTLKPVYDAAMKLKSENLCFSDLYIILMDLIFQVESLPSNDITKILKSSLNRRKTKLLGNDLFIAAIYLDPRIKVCLNWEEKFRAKQCIVSLQKHRISINPTDAGQHPPEQFIEHKPKPSSGFGRKSPTSFKDFLQTLDPTPENHFSLTSASLKNLESDLVFYEQQPRLALTANLLEFWYSQRGNTLSSLAEIILAIPINQVGDERLSSVLDYILVDRSNRLMPLHLEHILMIKCNADFNYEEE